MNDLSTILGLQPETTMTILKSALTLVSIFIVVSVGYYIYHYFVERDNK